MKVGRKLANKLLNVTKFVLTFPEADASIPLADAVTDPVDLSMLAKLDEVIAEATAGFEAFDYARALDRTESFFWWFCDNYVELVKGRAYNSRGPEAANSALRALREALGSVQRLFAPMIPFATEEAWSWWNTTSVHAASWPAPSALTGDATLIDPTIEALTLIRRAKSEAKVSQRADVKTVSISAPALMHAALGAGLSDLAAAGTVADISIAATDTANLHCDVTIAPVHD